MKRQGISNFQAQTLLEAICWRKESIASSDILTLVFVMTTNARNQEIVGEEAPEH